MKKLIVTALFLLSSASLVSANTTTEKSVSPERKQLVDKYAELGPKWLSSRLSMYWNTKAKDVYLTGEVYSHSGSNAAPEPTVMYCGARSHQTVYSRPSIDERIPYDEIVDQVLMRTPEGALEHVAISKTGSQVASMNLDILGIAADAAILYSQTKEPKYAELAAQTFDVFMAGIFYRDVPVDLNNGHQQTLVGITSFQVIHEKAISPTTQIYALTRDYLEESRPDRIDMYQQAFKRWAENIIDNGVPHNNWNLFQAYDIMKVALVLEPDSSYSDGNGREHYLDTILNQSSIRQWSLTKLAEYGYDFETGIWAECPGYSYAVIKDYVNFVLDYGQAVGEDLMPRFPILVKVIETLPEYLFPNRLSVGFGDTHPFPLTAEIYEKMILHAQRFDNRELEEKMTAQLKLFAPDHESTMVEVDDSIEAAKIEDFVSSTFYSPNVSWLVQRTGMDAQNSLMISLNGSIGNHAHANGISMELYGKGYTLGPDAGLGPDAYLGLQYLEYYGQFPAHNTVCVDGVSSYPIMKSQHAFKVEDCYPSPEIESEGAKLITYNDLSFVEPETQSDQNRLTSIITTSESSGYYVDLFRSKRRDGQDVMHDYFYHNLGQTMTIADENDRPLDLTPTQELSFAGAHIYAYSYIFDKKSQITDSNTKTTFTIECPDSSTIDMTMWQKGDQDRTIFSALSPMTEGLSRVKDMPYNISEQPTLTFVARQRGEAWTRPFVTIFEPSSTDQSGTIETVEYFDAASGGQDFIGIEVSHKTGRVDKIFSQTAGTASVKASDVELTGKYAVVSEIDDNNKMVFLGNGSSLKWGDVSIKADSAINVLLEQKDGQWSCVESTGKCVIKAGKTTIKL